jgi:ABC-2 type transport system ATP-binding protein
VILDEPFSGLDPVNAQLLIDTVRELQRNGTTVILSTHQMDQVEKLCDDIALIHRGKVILSGPVRDVKAGFQSDRVLVEYDGDDRSMQSIPNTEVVTFSAGRVELRMLDRSHSPNDLLRSMMDHANIMKFEVAEPSLHDIFVKAVS